VTICCTKPRSWLRGPLFKPLRQVIESVIETFKASSTSDSIKAAHQAA
jgi:hypothetical protein